MKRIKEMLYLSYPVKNLSKAKLILHKLYLSIFVLLLTLGSIAFVINSTLVIQGFYVRYVVMPRKIELIEQKVKKVGVWTVDEILAVEGSADSSFVQKELWVAGSIFYYTYYYESLLITFLLGLLFFLPSTLLMLLRRWAEWVLAEKR